MYIVDSHCDSIQQVDIRRHGIVNPYNYSNKHQQLQFVAAFCSWPGDDAEKCFRRAVRYIGHFKLRMEIEKDKVEQVYTYADIERAFAAGKHAALLTIEGGTGIVGSAQVFRDFYAAGVRVFGMTWLCNDLCASTRRDNGEDDYGLTDLGREIIEVGNELGMIFDVSHMSDKSFWDVAPLVKKPIIATHSNFRALCGHPRNLTDDMTREIIRQDGMIGLNFYPKFICDDPAESDIAALLRHLEYCLSLGGENNIGFGGDVDGTSGKYPKGLDETSSIHDRIIEYMLSHNYSEELVRKVAGENYLNFLKKYL
jgi:membrane dipeptidase